jgi:hypothetical protein
MIIARLAGMKLRILFVKKERFFKKIITGSSYAKGA